MKMRSNVDTSDTNTQIFFRKGERLKYTTFFFHLADGFSSPAASWKLSHGVTAIWNDATMSSVSERLVDKRSVSFIALYDPIHAPKIPEPAPKLKWHTGRSRPWSNADGYVDRIDDGLFQVKTRWQVP